MNNSRKDSANKNKRLVLFHPLKAIAVKNDVESIPKIHDLNKLAIKTGLEVDEELSDLFDVLTSFNIEARYPDYKKESVS
ncbi:MAG TPA: HEPN domain-containing protein [Ignavibacteria bacterium]|nr:HEPN domain-containing protein [Ignavibacteria bacterium]